MGGGGFAVRGRVAPLLALICAFWAAIPALAGPSSSDAAEAIVPISGRPGEVYMLRGFGDVFSRGLDEMTQALAARGIDAQVVSHTAWRRVLRAILDDRQRYGPRPIVLIGHSLGANAVIEIAEELQQRNIAVQYVATLAATGPDPVPANVQRADNFYFQTHGWGEPLVPGPGFSGTLRNLDFSDDSDVGHFNIDKQPKIQRVLLANIQRYAQ
jgi:pimeloyl-ACP methyl ester carboxylesterase